MSNRILTIFRRALLLLWLVLALAGAWIYHSGRLPDAETIIRGADARTDAMQAKTRGTIVIATKTLENLAAPDALKIEAASQLAAIGLARNKAFLAEGYTVLIGTGAADARMANDDHRDLLQALPGLVAATKSNNERLRLEAAYALAQMQLNGQYDYTLSLAKSLRNEFNTGAKAYLAQALGDIGMGVQPLSAAPELARLLLEDDPYVLTSAARAFAKIGPRAYREDAEARLVVLLKHSDAEVRETAAEALGSIGAYSIEAEQGLRAAMNDPSDWVQCTAAVALLDLAHQDEALVQSAARVFRLPPKTTLFVDDIALNRSMKQRAAGHLHARGILPDAAAADLANFVKESNDYLSNEQAIQTLARGTGYNAARADALVSTMLKKRLIHPETLDGLAAMGPEVAPHLEPLLKHSDPNLRDMAAQVLAKAGVSDKKAIGKLIKESRKDGEVGEDVIRALGGIRGADAEATQALVDRLRKDPNPNFKAEACKSLARLGPGARGAVPELAKWSAHDDDRLRPHAVMALVSVAPGDPATLDALRASLADRKYTDFKYLQALKAAGPVGEALVPELVAAYERDQDYWYREEVIKILAWLGHPSSLQFILDHASEKLHHGKAIDIAMRELIREVDRMRMHADADRNDRRRCIDSLGKLGLLDEAQMKSSLAAFEDPQLGARLRTQHGAYRKEQDELTKGDPAAAPYAKLPETRNPDLRKSIEMLRSPDRLTRFRAVRSLGLHAVQGAVEAHGILAETLRDPDQDVQAVALETMAKHRLAREENMSDLAALLVTKFRDGRPNNHAGLALGSLGESAVDVLIEASRHEELSIRQAAASGLSVAGAATEKARSRLEELLQDPNLSVSFSAKMALENLDKLKKDGES